MDDGRPLTPHITPLILLHLLPLASHPSHPYLPIGRFHGLREKLPIAQGADHPLPQGLAKPGQLVHVSREPQRPVHIFRLIFGDQSGEAETLHNARTDPGNMPIPHDGQHRNPHP